MMTDLARANAEKLDADLLQLLSEGVFAPQATFPVIVTVRPGMLQAVEHLVVGLQGELRHRLATIGAISAWMTAPAIAELSTSELVSEVELAQPMAIARDSA